MAGIAIDHERTETTPPHGDVIRLDVRAPAGTTPTSAILVAHGFKGFKDWGFFPLLCERLAQSGHLVVSFNFSLNGVGESLLEFTDLDAFGRNTFTRELEDLGWMVDRLAEGAWSRGPAPARIGLLGHSRGGGTSIITAAERDGIASLVTWASVSTLQRFSDDQRAEMASAGVLYIPNARTGQDMPLYAGLLEDLEIHADRLDVLAQASRVPVPWLVVHGADDQTVPVEEAHALGAVGPDATTYVIENAGHTFEAGHPLAAPPEALERAILATASHFEALR